MADYPKLVRKEQLSELLNIWDEVATNSRNSGSYFCPNDSPIASLVFVPRTSL